MRASSPSIHRALSLRANFTWTLVGNTIYAGCQWGILVVLAKLGSSELIGKFALALAITAPIFMFTNLQLRAVQATDATQSFAFGDYLGLRLVATSLGALAVIVIVLGTHLMWETALVVLGVGCAKTFEAISDVYYGLFQWHERMDRIAISLILRGVGGLAALSLGLYITGDLFWAVAGLAATWAIVLPLYDIPTCVRLLRASTMHKENSPKPAIVPRKLARLTWLALPLGIVMLLISLNTNIPRYFIEHYLSTSELGIFAALSYLMVAGNTVVAALGQAVSPRMARSYAQRNAPVFRSLLILLVGTGVVLGTGSVLVALVAGKQILTLLYRPEYARYTDVFLFLMLAAGIGYVAALLGHTMTAVRYFRMQIPLFVATTAVALIACTALIQGHGLLGASVALILAMTFQLIGSAVIVLIAVRRNWATGREVATPSLSSAISH